MTGIRRSPTSLKWSDWKLISSTTIGAVVGAGSVGAAVAVGVAVAVCVGLVVGCGSVEMAVAEGFAVAVALGCGAVRITAAVGIGFSLHAAAPKSIARKIDKAIADLALLCLR